MAKSSVPGLDRIRELFTSAERAVLESTVGTSLLEASRKQLAETLTRARAFRDKWHDVHAAQTRATKRSAGGGAAAANARSREKFAIFSAAIDRIRSQIAERGSARVGGRTAKKSSAKSSRRKEHRATRAGVKGSLAAAAADMNQGRATKPVTPRAAVVPLATVLPASASTPPRPKGAGGTPLPGKKRRPAKSAARTLAKAGGQAVRLDVAKQRAARASASATRLAFDGTVSRHGHVQAAGKRRQAARDRRGR